MVASAGVRELRNRTSELIELARAEGEVIITSHGKPVAVLRPYDAWRTELKRLLHAGLDPTDTGFNDELAADDEASMSDLDE